MQDTKNVTVEIVTRKTFQTEVPEDFDFSDDSLLNDLAEDMDNNHTPDTEDWESVTIYDDDEGDIYYI